METTIHDPGVDGTEGGKLSRTGGYTALLGIIRDN